MMRKKWVKGVLALAITSTLVTQPLDRWSQSYAQQIDKAYLGRSQAEAIIENIRFNDVSQSHWAQEAITRLGAIDIVKGYNENNQKLYRPESSVSNQEALAFILRILGMEEAAQQAAEVLEGQLQSGDPTLTLWSKGYLQLANQMGLITNNELQAAFSEDQGELVSGEDFIRTAPATREQVAEWLVKAINGVNPDLIQPVYQQNYLFNYSDWGSVGTSKIPYVEAVIAKKIMIGDNNRFRPKDSLTRAEMAQIIKNIDDILYDVKGIEQKHGVVEKIEEEHFFNNTLRAIRKVYIRNLEGGLDTLQYEYIVNSGQVSNRDVPVYKNNTIAGLSSLRDNDQVEYLIEKATDQALYVNVNGVATTSKVRGILQPLHQLNSGQITVKTPEGTSFTYPLSNRLYYDQMIKIGDHFVDSTKAPVGQNVVLELQNNRIIGIDYYTPNMSNQEISGVVKEVNPTFGYMVITDWATGQDITKHFHRNSISVQKQMHYDTIGSVGYIDGAFGTNINDPRNRTIDAIEPGDVVHIKLDASNPEYMTHISAKTNYVVKYGTIRQINYINQNQYHFTLQLEDGQIAYYEVTQPIVIKKGSATIAAHEVKAGDWVKLLVNQAVISPGHIEDRVKEITVDVYKNEITRVFKGQLGSYNPSQRTFSLRNSEELGQKDWLDYRQNRTLSIKDNQVEVFYRGQKISLQEAIYKYSGANYVAYVAMEKIPGSEQICRIAIYDDTRSTILNQDYVLSTDGGQSITLFNTVNPIITDPGTIIIRNGRLVEASNIVSPDYTQVVMGGASAAAIVNITEEPGNSGLTISRGRIKEIRDNQSFVVSSQGMLREMTWVYSPIERTYTIDYETIIRDENGLVPLSRFRDYDEWSQIDEVYTIISEGTKAKYLIKNPYATEGLTGTIYEVSQQGIKIKDVKVFNTVTKTWELLSLSSNHANILTEQNSIILKNNRAITTSELKIGDQIRVLTTENLIDKLKVEGSRETTGYVILVE